MNELNIYIALFKSTKVLYSEGRDLTNHPSYLMCHGGALVSCVVMPWGGGGGAGDGAAHAEGVCSRAGVRGLRGV